VTHFEWTTVILSVIAVLIIPAIVILIRGAVKWTRTEDRLESLVTAVEKLVDDKDKVHAAMVDQMTKDRDATDRRLRYLEERLMS
jgi:hypothetical protein